MNFLRQLKLEIRNILQVKFLLVLAIFIIAFSLLVPLVGFFNMSQTERVAFTTVVKAAQVYGAVARPIYKGEEPIIVDGFTVENDNPYYWQIKSLQEESYSTAENPFKTSAALDLYLALQDEEIAYFLLFARYVTSYQDYRMELSWRGVDSVYEKYFYEHNDADSADLLEVANFKRGIDPESFRRDYIDIDETKRLAGIERAAAELSQIEDILVKDDFSLFISISIDLANKDIDYLRENIALQEKTIIENPEQEENSNQMIEDMRRQISIIETNTIPILEYRLKMDLRPGLDIWPNRALAQIEASRSQLAYTEIMSEEEWNHSASYYKEQGQTYAQYVNSTQKQIDALNRAIDVAEKSLDSDKPDMVFVPQAARNQTAGFLNYGSLVALFGILLGGWLIASEYQQGTIRLLVIRPKTRSKILLSKFLAAVSVWLAITLISNLINLIANGIFFGFADFALPNYTVGGEINFWAYYLPKMLACLMPALFLFSFAFMFSVILRNTAVAIILPSSLYIVSFIALAILSYNQAAGWLVYTPLPFLQMPLLVTNNLLTQYMFQRGLEISITLGVLQLLVLSALFTALAVFVFKKRDIVN